MIEKKPKTGTAAFAAGCFWGVEEAFRALNGVKGTKVGYAGGNLDNAAYKDVCSGKTHHAEAVQIEFDPKQISFEELLKVFWSIHNPTTLNRQGLDFGEQYRSAIFFHSPEQKKLAEKSKKELEKNKKCQNKIVTQIVPASAFWKAEEYHQQYLMKRGQNVCH